MNAQPLSDQIGALQAELAGRDRMLRLAWERFPYIGEEGGESHAATLDTFLTFYRARAEECDEYPECEECRNTGRPWVEGAEFGLSGHDNRYFCGCEQGQDMKIEAARAKAGSET